MRDRFAKLCQVTGETILEKHANDGHHGQATIRKLGIKFFLLNIRIAEALHRAGMMAETSAIPNTQTGLVWLPCRPDRSEGRGSRT